MCGFFASFTNQKISSELAKKAIDSMHSRGPDGEGEWSEDSVYLGHKRLAILDVNSRSSQPMKSKCGRYVIAFNGEIYNFRDLRKNLESRGVLLNTTSDTEVILELFALEGESCLERLKGMFAFVIWDRQAKRAFAARDPYGIKPFYIAEVIGGVLVGSQVKSIMATGLVSRDPDLIGQSGFWMLGSVQEPHTWYRDIKALRAGHCCWIENNKVTKSFCWYDISDNWQKTEKSSQSLPKIREQVHDAIRRSVKRHMVSDVPVGVFLSGGIDSGALVGLMLDCGARDLEGVTITYNEFSGTDNDEAPVAAKIAEHYGIRHHVRKVTKEEFLQDLPTILNAMDQPSVDGVNTWYASKAVAECGYKVVMSGVGGDELFLGYDSFNQLPDLVRRWNQLSKYPGFKFTASLAMIFQKWRSKKDRWRFAPDWLSSIEGAWCLRRSINTPLEASLLMDTANDHIQQIDLVNDLRDSLGELANDPMLRLAQIESSLYMRNQLLRDSDWASMSHSVELRTPLVDQQLLEEVRQFLPLFYQFPKKSLLATAPLKPIPREIMERKKTGFGTPVKSWLADGRGSMGGSWNDWMMNVVQNYEKL